MTDQTPTIFEALNLVMRDVQAVRKGDRNGHGGFMFRGIDAVTNAVGPALREHGVIVVPEVLDAAYEPVVVGNNRTHMSRTVLRVRFTWWGPAGDCVVSVVQGEAFDSGDKATAKAHSVAFRTAMIQTLALPTDEPDPDMNVYERSPAAPENSDAPPAAPAVDRAVVEAALGRIASADIEGLRDEWRAAATGGYFPMVRDAIRDRRAALPPGGASAGAEGAGGESDH